MSNAKLALDKTEVKEENAAKELIVVIDGGYLKSNIKDARSFEAMIGSVFKPESLVFVDKHHNEIIQKTSVASALSDDQKTIKQLVLNACKQEGMNSKITKLTCLTDGTNCSGSLSKTPWLAFIGNNRLKLNDSINSLWLDLIDAENIPAQIK